MSRENVHLVQSIYTAWGRGDFSSAEWAHPEIELVFADWPPYGSWRGSAGMAEAFRDFLGNWDQFRAEAEEYRELDGERVLVLNQFGGRGKTSGLEVEQMRARGASLFHVRGGKVTKLVLYAERRAAIADLGLASDADYRE
jgi:ketosteroid isomerase-like protein